MIDENIPPKEQEEFTRLFKECADRIPALVLDLTDGDKRLSGTATIAMLHNALMLFFAGVWVQTRQDREEMEIMSGYVKELADHYMNEEMDFDEPRH